MVSLWVRDCDAFRSYGYVTWVWGVPAYVAYRFSISTWHPSCMGIGPVSLDASRHGVCGLICFVASCRFHHAGSTIQVVCSSQYTDPVSLDVSRHGGAGCVENSTVWPASASTLTSILRPYAMYSVNDIDLVSL